ncbi:hypothetical protein N8I77_008857 [Diaporthe amygdali]|uniref:Uncharacterized protein n=1 Tax=Phomopsis amygdali TaxID=1214568 RepID=A0AAD9S8Z1_PHOAM|nr:hypothetical protein N8I77_008857 [Diaporthe amygdali]
MEAVDWEIPGVDLGDIEIPDNTLSHTVAVFEQSPEVFSVPSDHDFVDIDLAPINLPNESLPIFDRFPEAFDHKLDEDVGNKESCLICEPSDRVSVFGQIPKPSAVDPTRLPYSWMVQNPGQMAESDSSPDDKLCRNTFFPRYVDASPGSQFVSNINAEKHMEVEFKRGLLSPAAYFFRAVGFSCIMDLNSRGFIHPTHFAVFIGRLFNGEPRFLHVFNRFFLPRELKIIPVIRCGVVYDCFLQLGRHLDQHPTHARHPQFKMLVKVLHHLMMRRVRNEKLQDEIVGKLVNTSNGQEFRPSPAAKTVLRGLKLSPQFLSQLSSSWPFKNYPWEDADEQGLYSTRGVNRKKSAGSLDPRLLVVRGRHRAWA